MPDADSNVIRSQVIACLTQCLDGAGAGNITDDTVPITGLGLDSADGIYFACAISQALGFELPNKVNPFVDDRARRARTVGEIVKLVAGLMAAVPVGATNA